MSWISKRLLAATAATVLVSTCGPASASTIVKIEHNLGLNSGLFNTVFIELFDDTPATRDNFLNYVNNGDFNGSVMHRLARLVNGSPFVLQGGGFTWNGSSFVGIPTNPPVVNEFGRSNLRGTIAMAKLAGDPDSATNQFFYNFGDNSANLDNQNGGFTVFARVLGNGMDLIDAFGTLNTSTIAGFSDVPFSGSQLLVMNTVSVFNLRVGDTDFSGVIDQADADLLTTLLLGDIDGDGFVGIADLNVVLGNWNQTVPPGDPLADVTGDNFVGIADLNAVLGAWNVGSPPPPAASVPEPASLALLGLGSVLTLSRRR